MATGVDGTVAHPSSVLLQAIVKAEDSLPFANHSIPKFMLPLPSLSAPFSPLSKDQLVHRHMERSSFPDFPTPFTPPSTDLRQRAQDCNPQHLTIFRQRVPPGFLPSGCHQPSASVEAYSPAATFLEIDFRNARLSDRLQSCKAK